MVKTIGIIGSRRRNSEEDFEIVKKKLLSYYREGDIIISGGCPKGADNFAERIARELGVMIIIHHANWKKHGKEAGIIRNTKIANESDWLIACVSKDRTGGTEDTIRKYMRLGKNAWVVV